MNKKSKVNLRMIRVFLFLMAVSWLGGSCSGGGNEAEVSLSESVETNLGSINMLPVMKNLSGGDIAFQVSFKNVGKEKIRILDMFRPLPVFFALNIEREDGTPIIVPSVGTASFLEGSMKYKVLSLGESFDFEFKLSEVFPKGLEKGKYRITVTYHNQYGKDCLKGRIEMKPIELEISNGKN